MDFLLCIKVVGKAQEKKAKKNPKKTTATIPSGRPAVPQVMKTMNESITFFKTNL